MLHTLIMAGICLAGEIGGESGGGRGVVVVKGGLLVVDVLFFAIGFIGLAWVTWTRRIGSLGYLSMSKLGLCAVLFGTPVQIEPATPQS